MMEIPFDGLLGSADWWWMIDDLSYVFGFDDRLMDRQTTDNTSCWTAIATENHAR